MVVSKVIEPLKNKKSQRYPEGLLSSAITAKSILDRMFRFACYKHYIEKSPTDTIKLKGIIQHHTKHQPALKNPDDVSKLLKAIDADTRLSNVIRYALQLLPLVCLRPKEEFAQAKWTEIDFENALWTVPRWRMKVTNRDHDHLIPLPVQAIAILRKLRDLSPGPWVFHSAHAGRDKPIAGDSVRDALVTLGFKGQMTAHGFRTTFMTLGRKTGREPGKEAERIWVDPLDPQAASYTLDHLEGREEELGYQQDDLLWVRRPLLQRWADYLDKLRGYSLIAHLNASPQRR
jgi:integrase